MKRANKFFTHLGFALLMGSLLVACGKDNRSGQNANLNQWGINGLGVGQYGQIGTVSNQVVAAAINENLCVGGVGSGRYAVQFPVNIPPFAAGDYYLGVTSFGDVAVVLGQGNAAQPIFVAYICSRDGLAGQQGRLLANPSLLSYSPFCGGTVKPMNATMVLPSVFGQNGLAFRWADGGTSQGQRFSFCTGIYR
ncbi:MAG: hypothetical protein ACOVP4_01780 [Bacteriovoracaceae bacterium]|jgi:hypothetical protein